MFYSLVHYPKIFIGWELAKNAEDKRALALKMDPQTCTSIGNELIDLGLMKVVALRIVTLQAEGVHTKTLVNSDVVVPSIIDASDLLIESSRLVASLRK